MYVCGKHFCMCECACACVWSNEVEVEQKQKTENSLDRSTACYIVFVNMYACMCEFCLAHSLDSLSHRPKYVFRLLYQ